jgi:hypothetical protein
MRSLLAAVAFAVLFLGPQSAVAAPTGKPSAPESSAPERVRLTIDHAGLLEHQPKMMADLVAGFVREDVTKALRDTHGLEVVDDPTAPAIIARLSWANYHDSVFRVVIAVHRPGQDAKTITQFERRFFPDDQVGQGIIDTLPNAVAELRKPQEEPSKDETAEPEPPPEDDTHGADQPANAPSKVDDSRSKVPLATLGKAGIGLLAGGVAVASVGAGLLAQGRKLDEQNAQPLYEMGRDYRTPSIVVLVSGGTLAAAGVVMLVLDRSRAKKRQQAALQIVPGLTGINIVGRF